jgi:hypothetical protein
MNHSQIVFFKQRMQFVKMMQRAKMDQQREEQGLPAIGHINKEYEQSYVKIFKSGPVIETYEYQKPVVLGRSQGGRSPDGERSLRMDENRKLSTRRARNNIRRLVNMNFDKSCKFVTLTFADHGEPQLQVEGPQRVEDKAARNDEGRQNGGVTDRDRTTTLRLDVTETHRGTKRMEESLGEAIEERERSMSETRKQRKPMIDIRNVEHTNKEFKKFIQRMRDYMETQGYDRDFPYLGVIEFQDATGRGAIHYHVIMKIPFVKNETLAQIWRNGFVNIRKVDSCDNLGAYLVKYMMKDLSDTRLLGKKGYLVSKGLLRPEVLTGEAAHTEIQRIEKENKKNKVYSDVYPSEYLGQIQYIEYNTERDAAETRGERG